MAFTALEYGTTQEKRTISLNAISSILDRPCRILCRRPATAGLVLLIATLVIFVAIGPWALADPGPLQSTNRFPLHMFVLTPRPVKATPPGGGELITSLALEYSNTHFDFRNQRWDLIIDMEVMIAELSMVYGLNEILALRVDLPFISPRDGFLDGFLENYHDFLGVPNYGREDRPKNEFAYRVTKDNRVWIDGKTDTFRIGESRFSALAALPSLQLGSQSVDSSILITLKIPTGNPDLGLGSGAYDVGLFLPMSLTGKTWSFYLMPGYCWISDPDTSGAPISSRNSYSFFAGVAYRYNERWRWLAQANHYASPFEKTGLSELDNGVLELSFGFQRQVGKSFYWEFAFSEDLTRSSPDFNIRLGVTWRLNHHTQH